MLHPYIYTAQALALIPPSMEGARPGVLPAHPVYYDWPHLDAAYDYKAQVLTSMAAPR